MDSMEEDQMKLLRTNGALQVARHRLKERQVNNMLKALDEEGCTRLVEPLMEEYREKVKAGEQDAAYLHLFEELPKRLSDRVWRVAREAFVAPIEPGTIAITPEYILQQAKMLLHLDSHKEMADDVYNQWKASSREEDAKRDLFLKKMAFTLGFPETVGVEGMKIEDVVNQLSHYQRMLYHQQKHKCRNQAQHLKLVAFSIGRPVLDEILKTELVSLPLLDGGEKVQPTSFTQVLPALKRECEKQKRAKVAEH